MATRADTRTPAAGTSARFLVGHLTALCLGGVLLSVNRSLLYPLLDNVAGDLHLSATQAGSIASIYFLFLLTSQVALSLFGDRLGLKRLLVIAFLLAGCAVLGFGLWTTNYPTVLLFVSLQGLTMGIFWPAAYTLAVSGVPEGKRGQATAIVGAGVAGGHAVGLALAGSLFQITSSWRQPFTLMAAPTALMAVLFIFLVRETRQDSANTRPSTWLSILRDRRLLSLFVAGFCTLYGLWLVTVWGPAFLQAERGLSVATSGIFIALVTAVAVPAGLVFGPLSDRVGRRHLSWMMFLISAVALTLIATVRAPWALASALIVFGLVGKFAWDPVLISWLADLVADDRSHVLSQVVTLSSIVGMSSSVIGPAVNGWIRDQTGSVQGAFFVGSALALIAAVLCSRVREVRH